MIWSRLHRGLWCSVTHSLDHAVCVSVTWHGSAALLGRAISSQGLPELRPHAPEAPIPHSSFSSSASAEFQLTHSHAQVQWHRTSSRPWQQQQFLQLAGQPAAAPACAHPHPSAPVHTTTSAAHHHTLAASGHQHSIHACTRPQPAILRWPSGHVSSSPQARHFHGSSSRQPSPVLVVQPRSRGPDDLQEALRLAETYTGCDEPPHLEVGRSSSKVRPVAATYFGSGTITAIKQQCMLRPDASAVFINTSLTAVQERNLSAALGLPVLDRVQLIIAIFAQRARTKEARLQVELASLNHQLSRLVRSTTKAGRGGFGAGGELEVVSGRQRAGGRGMGGGGGPGETEINLQRSRIVRKRAALGRQIEEVQRTRQVQRKARQAAGLPVVAVVGYTNAGKSTLVKALTSSHIYAQDQLFATLDPTARRLVLPSGRPCVITDTVGFIRDLPLKLVQAFRATLEEVVQADLLLHVLDASAPGVLQQRAATLRVLRELGLDRSTLSTGLVEVWNKVDAVPGWRQAVVEGQGQQELHREQGQQGEQHLRRRLFPEAEEDEEDVGQGRRAAEQQEVWPAQHLDRDVSGAGPAAYEEAAGQVGCAADAAVQSTGVSAAQQPGGAMQQHEELDDSWPPDDDDDRQADTGVRQRGSTTAHAASRDVITLLALAQGRKAMVEYTSAHADLPGAAVVVSAATGQGMQQLSTVLHQRLELLRPA